MRYKLRKTSRQNSVRFHSPDGGFRKSLCKNSVAQVPLVVRLGRVDSCTSPVTMPKRFTFLIFQKEDQFCNGSPQFPLRWKDKRFHGIRHVKILCAELSVKQKKSLSSKSRQAPGILRKNRNARWLPYNKVDDLRCDAFFEATEGCKHLAGAVENFDFRIVAQHGLGTI